MVSIKDFARDSGVSYEAIRKQVKRYEKELDGHIHRQGRTQYLDDVAVAFLSDHREKPALAIYDGAIDRKIQELEERVNSLLEEKANQADRISALAEWKAEHALALAEADRTRLALEASEAAQKALEASRDEFKTQAEESAQRASEEAQKAAEAIQEAQTLREQLEASQAREKVLEDKKREFDALPFWKKPFWKG